MAEIKSTLDLVMERTRHLTLSREEKAARETEDYKRKLGGLIQRYLDRLITPGQWDKEFNRLMQSTGIPDHALPARVILDRMTPDGDNAALMDLLSRTFHADTAEISRILADRRMAAENATQLEMDRLKKNLETEKGISGSAVMPNPDNSPALVARIDEIDKEFLPLLEQGKNAILTTVTDSRTRGD